VHDRGIGVRIQWLMAEITFAVDESKRGGMRRTHQVRARGRLGPEPSCTPPPGRQDKEGSHLMPAVYLLYSWRPDAMDDVCDALWYVPLAALPHRRWPPAGSTSRTHCADHRHLTRTEQPLNQVRARFKSRSRADQSREANLGAG